MLTQTRLREVLTYSEITGLFTWNTSMSSTAVKGATAGCLSPAGYIKLSVDGRSYQAHKLSFLYMLGYIPEYIDHKNMVKADNRWENLREATKEQNAYNTGIRKDNKSGVKGVSYDKHFERYVVQIHANKIRYQAFFSIRKFGSKDTALHEATLYAKRLREELHGEFVRHV